MTTINNYLVLTKSYLRSTIFLLTASIFCLTQLSGCGVVRRPIIKDGPPSVDFDVSKVHDAIPKVEPYHPYGRKDYVVNGKRYKVLKSAKGYVKKGYASWYGTKFHGNHTSTQERYSLYDMSAASTELPLPSYVEVTNLRNHKKVIVRVNDRGPFYANRIIDLSYAAAKKLGFANAGVAPVKVVAIDPHTYHHKKHKSSVLASYKNEHKLTPEAQEATKLVMLQLGAFNQFANAKLLEDKLKRIIDLKVVTEQYDDLYKVNIGPLTSIDQGHRLKDFLHTKGYSDVVLLK